MKEMKVDAIKNGTVIDHIPPGLAFKVIDLLKLSQGETVMAGINFSSKKHGRKDIVKIENRELSQDEVNRIALIAPDANLSIIRNYEIVSKSRVEVPRHIHGLIRCPNPTCITKSPGITTEFIRENREVVRCEYCEKPYRLTELEIIG
jgi:aspartate carbamoyltransferase regulatory subunit